MMKKTVKISILIILAAQISSLLYAQEEAAPKRRNPFKSQLPVKEIEVPVRPDRPVVQRPPVTQNLPRPIPIDTPAPIPAQDVKLPSVTISGIVWNTDRPQAIINGQVIDIGDTVSNMTIVAINKTGIDVSYQGQTMTIKLN